MLSNKIQNGACGIFSEDTVGGGSHQIMWYMENDKITFADPWARTTSGNVRQIEDASFYFGSYFNGNRPCIARLDNLKINEQEFDKYFNVTLK